MHSPFSALLCCSPWVFCTLMCLPILVNQQNTIAMLQKEVQMLESRLYVSTEIPVTVSVSLHKKLLVLLPHQRLWSCLVVIVLLSSSFLPPFFLLSSSFPVFGFLTSQVVNVLLSSPCLRVSISSCCYFDLSRCCFPLLILCPVVFM